MRDVLLSVTVLPHHLAMSPSDRHAGSFIISAFCPSGYRTPWPSQFPPETAEMGRKEGTFESGGSAEFSAPAKLHIDDLKLSEGGAGWQMPVSPGLALPVQVTLQTSLTIRRSHCRHLAARSMFYLYEENSRHTQVSYHQSYAVRDSSRNLGDSVFLPWGLFLQRSCRESWGCEVSRRVPPEPYRKAGLHALESN